MSVPSFVVDNRSTVVSDGDARTMIAACNQFLPVLAQAWSLPVPSVAYAKDLAAAQPDAWLMHIVDEDPSMPGNLAYHTEEGDEPDAYILAKTILRNKGAVLYGGPNVTTVAAALFHEIAETYIDPTCNAWWQGPDGGLYAAEVCDPVQGTIVPVSIGTAVNLGEIPATIAAAPAGAVSARRRPRALAAKVATARAATAFTDTIAAVAAAQPARPGCSGCGGHRGVAASAAALARPNARLGASSAAAAPATVGAAATAAAAAQAAAPFGTVVGLCDFVYPAWRDPEAPAGPATRFDYARVLQRPFQVAPHGYAIVMRAAGQPSNVYGEAVPEWLRAHKDRAGRVVQRRDRAEPRYGDVLYTTPIQNGLNPKEKPFTNEISALHYVPPGRHLNTVVNPAQVNTLIPAPALAFSTIHEEQEHDESVHGEPERDASPPAASHLRRHHRPTNNVRGDVLYTTPTLNGLNPYEDPYANVGSALHYVAPGRHFNTVVNPAQVNTVVPPPAIQPALGMRIVGADGHGRRPLPHRGEGKRGRAGERPGEVIITTPSALTASYEPNIGSQNYPTSGRAPGPGRSVNISVNPTQVATAPPPSQVNTTPGMKLEALDAKGEVIITTPSALTASYEPTIGSLNNPTSGRAPGPGRSVNISVNPTQVATAPAPSQVNPTPGMKLRRSDERSALVSAWVEERRRAAELRRSELLAKVAGRAAEAVGEPVPDIQATAAEVAAAVEAAASTMVVEAATEATEGSEATEAEAEIAEKEAADRPDNVADDFSLLDVAETSD